MRTDEKKNKYKMPINIELSIYNGDCHSVSIHTTIPLLPQIKAKLLNLGYTEQKCTVTFDGFPIKEEATSRQLGIKRGEDLEVFFPVTKRNANQGLVSHINSERFNSNTCVYMGPDIAMWTIK